MDPDEAVAKKRHLGAPAGLDFDYYAKWLGAERAALKAADGGVRKAFAKLLPEAKKARA